MKLGFLLLNTEEGQLVVMKVLLYNLIATLTNMFRGGFYLFCGQSPSLNPFCFWSPFVISREHISIQSQQPAK